ncbi:MAG TPA: nucleotidyltransferase domain-containing protein [Stellaceae bacterium]|nr:nucleotidyltransferase domain-containing protein [Stellaceae bacterium]
MTTLRMHRRELRRGGIVHLSLIGSAARGEADAGSDVDLLAEVDPEMHLGLFGLVALKRRLSDLLRRDVDLLTMPIENPRLRENVVRDARRAF